MSIDLIQAEIAKLNNTSKNSEVVMSPVLDEHVPIVSGVVDTLAQIETMKARTVNDNGEALPGRERILTPIHLSVEDLKEMSEAGAVKLASFLELKQKLAELITQNEMHPSRLKSVRENLHQATQDLRDAFLKIQNAKKSLESKGVEANSLDSEISTNFDTILKHLKEDEQTMQIKQRAVVGEGAAALMNNQMQIGDTQTKISLLQSEILRENAYALKSLDVANRYLYKIQQGTEKMLENLAIEKQDEAKRLMEILKSRQVSGDVVVKDAKSLAMNLTNKKISTQVANDNAVSVPETSDPWLQQAA
jgi:hypothetical protein